MQKTIVITGATDGIGFETAKILAEEGHNIILHGRSPAKLEAVKMVISDLARGKVEGYLADLSRLEDVETMAKSVVEAHDKIDVLINNAGVLKAPNPITAEGMDIRFVVNTIAPYLLTQRLLPILGASGRVINLSSAAQSTVDVGALSGEASGLNDMEAYAQSKLAITMWSNSLAQKLGDDGAVVIAVNPGSLLASKMVKEGFGVAGNDIGIGADILVRLALDEEFAHSSGQYFDNDKGAFSAPHSDALDADKCAEVLAAIEAVLV